MSRLALARPLFLFTLAALGACADDGPATSALDHELALTLGRGPDARALAVRVGAATVDGPRVAYAITVAGAPGHVAYDLATGARAIALGDASAHVVVDGAQARLCADPACAAPLAWSGEADDPAAPLVALAGLDLVRAVPVPGVDPAALPAIGAPMATASLVPRTCYLLGSAIESEACASTVVSCYGGGQGPAACFNRTCVGDDAIGNDGFCINL